AVRSKVSSSTSKPYHCTTSPTPLLDKEHHTPKRGQHYIDRTFGWGWPTKSKCIVVAERIHRTSSNKLQKIGLCETHLLPAVPKCAKSEGKRNGRNITQSKPTK
ncbi:unnamed protein product, partial [Ectocarpus fasciculatus]